MELRTKDGLRITYDAGTGEEPTLILIHGWIANRTVWHEVEYALANRYLALDLRGHGASDKPDDEDAYRLERFSDDIIRLLDKERIPQAVLVGHSMGGMIALMTDDSRIAGRVLINSTASLKERLSTDPVPFLRRLIAFFEQHEHLIPTDLSKHYTNDMMTFIHGVASASLAASIGWFEATYEVDLSERARSITTPTLVIGSTHDAILPNALSEHLGELLHTNVMTIDSHHFSVIKDAETIASAINAFIEAHIPANVP